MDQPVIPSRLQRSANKILLKAKALAEMQQDTIEADKVHPPDKQDGSKETKDPKLARVTRTLMRRQQLWGRVKDRIPDIVKLARRESKSKSSESGRSSTPQSTDSKIIRSLSFPTRGKELLKNGLTKWKAKAEEEDSGEEEPKKEKRKRPDSLEQWFFDHSGGTLRERP
ncbi:hypothetical protein M434DRAFT_32223 [Hypoxylon sp. CO27-5]|nr:hypothetical protein M434DRAFT_32223 [Hypoxylon sp. CO27-5]